MYKGGCFSLAAFITKISFLPVRPIEILRVASAGEPAASDNGQLVAGHESLHCSVIQAASIMSYLGLNHLLRGTETEPQGLCQKKL